MINDALSEDHAQLKHLPMRQRRERFHQTMAMRTRMQFMQVQIESMNLVFFFRRRPPLNQARSGVARRLRRSNIKPPAISSVTLAGSGVRISVTWVDHVPLAAGNS